MVWNVKYESLWDNLGMSDIMEVYFLLVIIFWGLRSEWVLKVTYIHVWGTGYLAAWALYCTASLNRTHSTRTMYLGPTLQTQAKERKQGGGGGGGVFGNIDIGISFQSEGGGGAGGVVDTQSNQFFNLKIHLPGWIILAHASLEYNWKEGNIKLLVTDLYTCVNTVTNIHTYMYEVYTYCTLHFFPYPRYKLPTCTYFMYHLIK